jgi:hypothetical protein
MTKVDSFTYLCGNAVLKFFPCELNSGEKTQKFSFLIENDEVLTKKILESVRKKRVTECGVFYIAATISEIIEKGNFDKVAKSDEIVNLFVAFQKKFKKNPEFEITGEDGFYQAELINYKEAVIIGTGGTRTDARFRALEQLFPKE